MLVKSEPVLALRRAAARANTFSLKISIQLRFQLADRIGISVVEREPQTVYHSCKRYVADRRGRERLARDSNDAPRLFLRSNAQRNSLAHVHRRLSTSERVVDNDGIRVLRRQLSSLNDVEIEKLRVSGQSNNTETALTKRSLRCEPAFSTLHARRVAHCFLNLLELVRLRKRH